MGVAHERTRFFKPMTNQPVKEQELPLWERYADQFPVRRDSIYLKHAAAVAPLVKPAAEAMQNLADDCARFGSLHYDQWMSAYEGLRDAAARLINRPRSVVGLEVADGLDRAFAIAARHRTRSRPGITGRVQRGQIARRCRSRGLGSRGRLNDFGYGRHQGRRVAIGIGIRSVNRRGIAGQRLGHARFNGRGR